MRSGHERPGVEDAPPAGGEAGRHVDLPAGRQCGERRRRRLAVQVLDQGHRRCGVRRAVVDVVPHGQRRAARHPGRPQRPVHDERRLAARRPHGEQQRGADGERDHDQLVVVPRQAEDDGDAGDDRRPEPGPGEHGLRSPRCEAR